MNESAPKPEEMLDATPRYPSPTKSDRAAPCSPNRPDVVRVDYANLDNVVEQLLLGLTTDGAHHKQHYLEAALRTLVEPKWVDEAKAKFEWESGIPS